MLPGDQCSGGVSELAEGYTYMRGRCKQLGGLQVGDRDELECFSASEYDALILKDGLFHRSESFDQRSEDICRRISICIIKKKFDIFCSIKCNYLRSLFPFNDIYFK